jgi:uncharacterized protein (TIGR00725 family)
MASRYPQITVIGDSDISGEQYEEAVTIGQAIGSLGAVIITGGRGGIMEAVSKGGHMAGAVVAGILPSSMIDDANPFCDVVFPTGMGHARNALTVMAADLVVAIGGGAGTLSEISFAWIYGKPVIAWEGRGWSGKMAGQSLDNRSTRVLRPCHDTEDLKTLIKNHCRLHQLKFNE